MIKDIIEKQIGQVSSSSFNYALCNARNEIVHKNMQFKIKTNLNKLVEIIMLNIQFYEFHLRKLNQYEIDKIVNEFCK